MKKQLVKHLGITVLKENTGSTKGFLDFVFRYWIIAISRYWIIL